MSRHDAMLRLYHRLITQRESLRQKLAEDLGMNYTPDDGINDLGEQANQVEQTELHSQLAALESREISQIDIALEKLRTGSYGTCDRCQKGIPFARLQALPFTAVCVECQRKREERGGLAEEYEANWRSAVEYERRSVDHEFSVNDFDQ